MVVEIAWPPRLAFAFQVLRRRHGDDRGNTDLARDQARIRERAITDGKVDAFFDQNLMDGEAFDIHAEDGLGGCFGFSRGLGELNATGFAAAVVEWSPDVPEQLSAEELQAYQVGRNAALAEIAQELGIRVAVIDLK